jgi:hypothetical protein
VNCSEERKNASRGKEKEKEERRGVEERIGGRFTQWLMRE